MGMTTKRISVKRKPFAFKIEVRKRGHYYRDLTRAVIPSSRHYVAIRSHHEDGPRAAARREISLHPARETGGIRRLHDEERNGQGPPHRIYLRAIHDRHVRRDRVAALHGQNDRLLHESALQVDLHGDAA